MNLAACLAGDKEIIRENKVAYEQWVLQDKRCSRRRTDIPTNMSCEATTIPNSVVAIPCAIQTMPQPTPKTSNNQESTSRQSESQR
jgi:hypothetical protein